MSDSMAPAKQSRTSRLSSTTSSRREDSLGVEQQSMASNNGAADGQEQDKPDTPKLDWSKFKATFTVKHSPIPKPSHKASKKRKRGAAAREPMLEENEFDKNLSTLYTVEPVKWWEDTRRYRKFTISTETFRLGDTVWVKPDDSETVDAPLQNWVAKVLEVRAASEAHVFLRIFWMYRPEDIPGGRRPYHGKNEVIASNTMQVIDALTVNGKANMRHWTEDDNDEVLDADQLFWRQTFDCPDGSGTGELSTLRKHCIDEAPFNPDTLLIHCDACGLWLHSECLEHEAIRQAHEENKLPEPILVPASQRSATMSQTTPNGHVSHTSDIDVKTEESERGKIEPVFQTEVISGTDVKSQIILKDTREGHEGEEYKKEIYCLKCKALIE